MTDILLCFCVAVAEAVVILYGATLKTKYKVINALAFPAALAFVTFCIWCMTFYRV